MRSLLENCLLARSPSQRRRCAWVAPTPKRETAATRSAAADHASELAALRAEVRKSRKNLNAPLAAIDAVEAAAVLPFDEGCRNERRIFDQCLFSSEARA